MKHLTTIRIVAIASSGGHWVQLQRMRQAWDGCDAAYITTEEGLRNFVIRDARDRNLSEPRFYTVISANRWQKIRLLRQAVRIATILLRERPNIVISTGAAPGFFAIKFGKMLGARTIWVDSIANAEMLSLSGKKAGSCADLWLTQWEHLEGSEDPEHGLPRFKGAVV